jgi:citrate lyase subunit beta / citryl-CoA lyase
MNGTTQPVVIGNAGDKVRSDVQVTFEITSGGGIDLDLKSKVGTLFGAEIRNQVHEILYYYGITHASVRIQDSGALPFVIAARLEAAIRKAIGSDQPYLMPLLPQNKNLTARDATRFSRLYLPGNTPSLMINAGLHQPHGIILDLEDAVAFEKKYEARFLVRNALRSLDFYGVERMVRINQVPAGLEDLEFIVPHFVNLILVPKCESAAQIIALNERMEEIKSSHQITHDIWLMPIIESGLGVEKAFEIASAASNVVALAIGLEDYTADLGTRRTNEGDESFYARSRVVNAAKAAGIQAIDSVFSDIADMEALKANVIRSKALGFDGMGCIHPRQIRVIHANYAPGNEEIEKAKKIVVAFKNATALGLGVVSLGTKMIDPPVVKRALKCVEMAVKLGLLNENWTEDHE